MLIHLEYIPRFVGLGWNGTSTSVHCDGQDANRQLLVGAAVEPKLSELERVQSLVQAIRIESRPKNHRLILCHRMGYDGDNIYIYITINMKVII